MQVKHILGVVLMACLLASCAKLDKSMGSFKPDRDTAYLKADIIPPLELPQGYKLDERYAVNYHQIPQGKRPLPGSEPISIVPPTLEHTGINDDDTTS